MSPEHVASLHERASRLRAEADAAAHERDAAIAQTLEAGQVRGPELARRLGLSTQRLYDMAGAHRRRTKS